MLDCQKALFSLPADVHYLNAATMSPNLNAVEAAGIEGIRQKSEPHRITQETFFEVVEAVKPLFAKLLNADDPQRVALIPSVSYGMATVAKNVQASPSQRVVLVEGEFPSDVFAWEPVCRAQGLQTHVVAAPEAIKERGRRWNERLLDAITPGTALVVLSPVHWADGTLFDCEAVGQRCREMGAWLVIDGTQTLGSMPFDVQKIRPDAVVAGGYKGLMGPYSQGLAWFGEAFDDGSPLEENWINRAGSENFRNLMSYSREYRPGAARYSMGEQSNFILLPMLRAALEQLLAWTPAGIQEYCRGLVAPFVSEWERVGFSLEIETSRASHLFGLRPPTGLDLDALREELARRRVYVSVRGDAIRVSPHVYNDAADLAALTNALATTRNTASV